MSTPTESVSWKKTFLLSFVVLFIAGGLVVLIFSTEPKATKSGATKKTAMLVEVMTVERGAFRPQLVVTGSVRAERDITLSPEVGGRVLSRAEGFTPGGFVNRGEVLVQIDPSDYRNALLQSKSAHSQANTRLRLEMGRQEIAEQEYEHLVDGELSERNKDLMLREPQLEAALGEVRGSEAAVRQAQLDLARTTIEAPFDAHVISRAIDVGSRVAPGSALGRLVGIEKYWVEAAVPLAMRRWLRLPRQHVDSEGDQSPQPEACSEVRIENPATWAKGAHRMGCLTRMVGTLDETTRMVRVLIEIPDPLARSDDTPPHAPPLMIGEFVEARIEGRKLENVVRLSRDYVRKDDTAWLMKDGVLQIVDLEIVVRDSKHAYVTKGLQDGDEIVTTNLSTVTDGAKLRVEGSRDE